VAPLAHVACAQPPHHLRVRPALPSRRARVVAVAVELALRHPRRHHLARVRPVARPPLVRAELAAARVRERAPTCPCCRPTTFPAATARSGLQRSGGTPTSARAWLCGARYSFAVALLVVVVAGPPDARTRAPWAGAATRARRRARKHNADMETGSWGQEGRRDDAMRSGVGERSNGSSQ
jgi:hypothetical protein